MLFIFAVSLPFNKNGKVARAFEELCRLQASTAAQNKQTKVGTSRRKTSIPRKTVRTVENIEIDCVKTEPSAQEQQAGKSKGKNSGKPRLTVKEKAKILQLHEEGLSNGGIAREMMCSKSTIARWLHRWKTEGHVWVRAVNGRPRVTTAQQDANIVAVINSDNALTSKNIQQQLNINASRRTIIRRLGEAGLYGQWANKKDFVKENQRILRLSFAKEYVTYPLEFWRNVIFTDTYVISLTQNGRISMHRPYEINHHVPKYRNAEVHSVYIWAWISMEGICDLWQIEGNFTRKQYRSILRDKMIPSCLKKLPNSELCLLQDRTPIQISRLAREWCKKTGVNVLSWPSRAADVKPIERVCTEIKNVLSTSLEPPTNQLELSRQVQLVWGNLMSMPGYVQSLILSVPLRLATVISNNGELT